MYYCPGATHFPHHVPQEWADRYTRSFNVGWDRLREEIFARQLDLGVVPEGTKLSARPDWLPAWDSLDDQQRKVLARQMEVYAAFLEHTDHHIAGPCEIRRPQSLRPQPKCDADADHPCRVRAAWHSAGGSVVGRDRSNSPVLAAEGDLSDRRYGGPFHDPATDAALFGAIRSTLDQDRVELVELEVDINDPGFARAMVGKLEAFIKIDKKTSATRGAM